MRIVIQIVLIVKNRGFIGRVAARRARAFHGAGQVDIIGKYLLVLRYIAHVPSKRLILEIIGEVHSVYLVIGQNIRRAVVYFVAVSLLPVFAEPYCFYNVRRIALARANLVLSNDTSIHITLLIERINAYSDGGVNRAAAIFGIKRCKLQVILAAHLIGEYRTIARLLYVAGYLSECPIQPSCCIYIIIVVCGVRSYLLQDVLHRCNGYFAIIRKAEAYGVHLCTKTVDLLHILIVTKVFSTGLIDNSKLCLCIALYSLSPSVLITVAIVKIAMATFSCIIICALQPIVPKFSAGFII